MIAEAYKRWRHSRGFGVHSPFAYHIVTTAVRPGRRYAYYGYQDIDTVLETAPAGDYGYRKIRKDARLLLRLAVALDAKRIFIPEDAHPALRAAAIASGTIVANDKDICCSSAGDLVVIPFFDTTKFANMRDALAGHSGVMLTSPTPFPENLLRGILSQEFEGVMLYGKRIALLLPREQTAHARYSMLF